MTVLVTHGISTLVSNFWLMKNRYEWAIKCTSFVMVTYNNLSSISMYTSHCILTLLIFYNISWVFPFLYISYFPAALLLPFLSLSFHFLLLRSNKRHSLAYMCRSMSNILNTHFWYFMTTTSTIKLKKKLPMTFTYFISFMTRHYFECCSSSP